MLTEVNIPSLRGYHKLSTRNYCNIKFVRTIYISTENNLLVSHCTFIKVDSLLKERGNVNHFKSHKQIILRENKYTNNEQLGDDE